MFLISNPICCGKSMTKIGSSKKTITTTGWTGKPIKKTKTEYVFMCTKCSTIKKKLG